MPQKQKIRTVIDTNIWISFLLTKDYSKLDTLIRNRRITILFSEELLEEFLEVTQRRKFKKYFATNDVKDLLRKINSHAVFIEAVSDVSACRDEKDNFLLSLAKDGKATHLITGDKDLLVLEKFGRTKTITITDFLNKIF